MANTWNQANTTWGQNQWGDQADVDVSITAPTQLSTAVGSLNIIRYPGWGTLDYGENGWGSVEAATETLTGLSLTSAVGAIAPADVMGLTGLSATSAFGSLSFTIDSTFTLSGQAATTTVGSIIVGVGIPLTGLALTTAIGSPVARGDYTESLTGLSALGAVGL
jgi:hypothetical protein